MLSEVFGVFWLITSIQNLSVWGCSCDTCRNNYDGWEGYFRDYTALKCPVAQAHPLAMVCYASAGLLSLCLRLLQILYPGTV